MAVSPKVRQVYQIKDPTGLPQIMLILQSSQEAVARHPLPSTPDTQVLHHSAPVGPVRSPCSSWKRRKRASPPRSWGQSGARAEERPAQNSGRPSHREAQLDVAPGSSVQFRESWQVWFSCLLGVNSAPAPLESPCPERL